MNQLDIVLTVELLKMLMDGQPMSLRLDELDLLVTLSCDPGVQKSFRDTVDAAMLEFLPGPSSVH